MTQEEFNAWIAAQGGPQAVQFANENKTVPNPAKQDPANRIDDTIPPTITVNVQTWVNPKTGARLSLSPKGSGQYEVIDQVGPKPATATDPGAAAQDANQVELQKQRERNAALPKEQDPAYETDAERRARGRQTAIDQQTAANAKGGGTILERPDGVYIVKPDGTTVKTLLPGKPQPGQNVTAKADDGSTWVITVAPDGNVTTKLAIPATPAGPPVPASATGWKPDPSKPDGGIFDRRSEVQKMLESGVFGDPASAAAQAKANDLLKQDLELTKVTLANIGSIQQGEAGIYSGAVSQRGQDIQQTDARLQAATTTFNSALGQIASLLPYAKEHSKTAGPALDALLEKAYAFQQKLGGLRDSPQVQPGDYMTRKAAIFQPNQNPSAPMPFPQPAAAAPAAPAAPSLPATPPPGMTGAPGYVPAQPRPTGQLTIPPPPPMSEQPRDTTGVGYPGTVMPAPPMSEQPRDTTGPQYPGAVSPAPVQTEPAPGEQAPTVTQLPPALTLLQQQPVLGGGDVLSWAQGMGFDPSVLAMFAQGRGQGV